MNNDGLFEVLLALVQDVADGIGASSDCAMPTRRNSLTPCDP
jgi:hypothetical protein